MDDDFDVEDFRAPGDFITKEELQASGPQKKRVEGVEQREGFKNKAGKAQPEPALLFSDGRKMGLRAQVNRDAMRDVSAGARVAGPARWSRSSCDPSVRNPQGARVGGVRLRGCADGGGPLDFTSDLELDDEDVPTGSTKVPV